MFRKTRYNSVKREQRTRNGVGRLWGRDPPSSGVVTQSWGIPVSIFGFRRIAKIGTKRRRPDFGVVTPQLGSWPKVRETPWKSLETHYGAVFFIKLKKEEGGWRKVSAVNVDVQSGDRSSGRWSIGVRPSVSVWWMKLDAARRRQIASGANASEGELDSTPWNAGNLT